MRDPEILGRCLVEGEEGAALRSPRRRRSALLAALTIQAGLLGALLLIPILGTAERLQAKLITPTLPYRGVPAAATPAGAPPRGAKSTKPPLLPAALIQPQTIPKNVVQLVDAPEITGSTEPAAPGSAVPGTPGGIDLPGLREPRALSPVAPAKSPPPTQPIRIGEPVQQARLTHRVQPVYPPLARQLRLEGTVHLRAIISRDGAVRELEVLSGHPWLVRASTDAVQQWRYQPTMLNGQPVEVETRITVIFILNR